MAKRIILDWFDLDDVWGVGQDFLTAAYEAEAFPESKLVGVRVNGRMFSVQKSEKSWRVRLHSEAA